MLEYIQKHMRVLMLLTLDQLMMVQHILSPGRKTTKKHIPKIGKKHIPSLGRRIMKRYMKVHLQKHGQKITVKTTTKILHLTLQKIT